MPHFHDNKLLHSNVLPSPHPHFFGNAMISLKKKVKLFPPRISKPVHQQVSHNTEYLTSSLQMMDKIGHTILQSKL